VTFRAKFKGRCPHCRSSIEPGDHVVYVNDELVHLECEDIPKPAERPEEVCTVCWLVKPCDCGVF
jgi:hypothetical protein